MCPTTPTELVRHPTDPVGRAVPSPPWPVRAGRRAPAAWCPPPARAGGSGRPALVVARPFRQQVDEGILDRAAALFARRGFAKTSVPDTADAVGPSKAGPAHHPPR